MVVEGVVFGREQKGDKRVWQESGFRQGHTDVTVYGSKESSELVSSRI